MVFQRSLVVLAKRRSRAMVRDAGRKGIPAKSKVEAAQKINTVIAEQQRSAMSVGSYALAGVGMVGLGLAGAKLGGIELDSLFKGSGIYKSLGVLTSGEESK